jgi:hypothetical protein
MIVRSVLEAQYSGIRFQELELPACLYPEERQQGNLIGIIFSLQQL